MKSKYLAFGLSALLALSMVSCGNQQAQEPQEPKQEEIQQAEPVSTPSAVEPMEIKQEVDTVLSTEPGGAEPGEVEGSGTVEGSGSVESDLVEVELFTEVNETVYATGTVNLRNGAGTTFDKVGSLSAGESVTRTGIGTGEAEGWSRIQLSNGSVVYVSSSYLSTVKPAATSSGGGGSTTTTQTQQQGGQTNSQTQGQTQAQAGETDAAIAARREEVINGMYDFFEQNGYQATTGGRPMTTEEKQALAGALNGETSPSSGSTSSSQGKSQEELQAELDKQLAELNALMDSMREGN